ncbi:XP_014773205.1PREDICTED: uncharacterized protein LOC106871329 isoform X1 [Octopus vulgaris]|uniref:XP_014773205.1PREDICTED: uncharacterized protein LOC106871329 isoform X1 n=1 Tax=Octopus vulgaris TaxID=6645 RepID=A0AA36B6E7_OCTVU|nr:XP_014773205.1PREDICTED: uncharacterized protein LOC106871329 isoform X1 [Octopus vulgaris]
MAYLLLKGAPLPSEINDVVVKNLIDQFNEDATCNEENIVNEIAILDFINRIFIADQSPDIKMLFMKHGILLKIESVLDKLEEHNGHLFPLLSMASLSVLYHLSTVPKICSAISANQNFVHLLFSALKRNESDYTNKFAVSCLCNFTWFDPDLCLLFDKLSGSEILLKTAKASSQLVKIDVLKIFCNFCLETNLIKHSAINSADILKFVIEICNEYLENKLQFGNKVDSLLKYCMLYLSNAIFKNRNIKKHFYILGGTKMIARLLYLCPASMLCRPFIQGVVKHLVYLKRKDPSQNILKEKLHQHTKTYLPALRTVEENLADFRLYDGCDEDPEMKCTNYLKKSNGYDIREKPFKLQDGCYQYGAQVPFIKDTTHAILANKTNWLTEIGQTVCGMLNSRRNCTLYFGISNTYKVVGVHLSREEKDKFRLHCDQIFTQMIKPLIISNVTVDFKPVLNAKKTSSNLHIIEISTFAQESFHSFKGKCYFRHNGETQLVGAEMLRLMVIGAELEKWKLEEKKWKDELDRLTTIQARSNYKTLMSPV